MRRRREELSARLLAQLGFVALFDAQAAVPDPYAWPPKRPPTEEEKAEQARLTAVADAIFDRAQALGFRGGTDAAFSGE